MIALLLSLGSPALAEAPAPGPHAMVVEVASRSKVPFAGTTEVITRSLVRVDLVREGDGWTQSQRVCAVEIESDSRATTVLPQAFIDVIPVQRYPVQISENGTYKADPGPTYVGFDPKVTGGAVPRKKNDPGVQDTDGDGHPGVTVLLDIPVFGKVKMYVAQAGWSRYDGAYRDGRFAGAVESVSLDQRTLGASVSAFAANPDITAVPERSRFIMSPLTEPASCARLASRWSRTFEIP